MTLLRLLHDFGIKDGLALWLLPWAQRRTRRYCEWADGPIHVRQSWYRPDPTHETWTA